MLKLNFIGEVLKDWTKNEYENGTCEYTVRVGISEQFKNAAGELQIKRSMVIVKVFRRAENCADFEKDLKVGKTVYAVCSMPTAECGKNAKTEQIYGFLASKQCRQFFFIGDGQHFITLQGIGRVTADAETNDLKNDAGRKAVNFSIACSERVEGKDANGFQNQNTVFVNGGLFRAADKTGVAQYLTKGKTVYVEGVPVVRTGTDKSGNGRAYFNAEFSNVEFVAGSRSDAGQETAGATVPVNPAEPNFVPNMPDDLPF